MLTITIDICYNDNMKKLNLVGKKINHLTVLECVGHKGKKVLWKCLCDCGKYVYANTNALTGNHTISCGCWKRNQLINRNTKHNQSKTKLYNVWIAIKKRCNNNTDTNYPRYGGRGIKICNEWENDYNAFYQWSINNGYCEGLTIDRIDNNGDYTPLNCRWTNKYKQANNRSNNRIITINHISKTIAEWCRFYNTSETMIRARLSNGWEPIKALTTPPLRIRKVY